MEVLINVNNPSSFCCKSLSNNNIVENIQNECFINGHSNDSDDIRLNPVIKESLNSLVNAFENSKFQKQYSYEYTSNHNKEKLSISLPNLFLPLNFDDNGFCNIERRVQWNHTLNFDLKKLKNAFSDTYYTWCHKKRSHSIPVIRRYATEYYIPISSEIINAKKKPKSTKIEQQHHHVSEFKPVLNDTEHENNIQKISNALNEGVISLDNNAIEGVIGNKSLEIIETNPVNNDKSESKIRGRPRLNKIKSNYRPIKTIQTVKLKNKPEKNQMNKFKKKHPKENKNGIDDNGDYNRIRDKPHEIFAASRRRGRPRREQEAPLSVTVSIYEQKAVDKVGLEGQDDTKGVHNIEDMPRPHEELQTIPQNNVSQIEEPILLSKNEMTMNDIVPISLEQTIEEIMNKEAALEEIPQGIIASKSPNYERTNESISESSTNSLIDIISQCIDTDLSSISNTDNDCLDNQVPEKDNKQITYVDQTTDQKNIRGRQSCAVDDLFRGSNDTPNEKVSIMPPFKRKSEPMQSSAIIELKELQNEESILTDVYDVKHKPLNKHLKRSKHDNSLFGPTNNAVMPLNCSQHIPETHESNKKGLKKKVFKQPLRTNLSSTSIKSKNHKKTSNSYDIECILEIPKTSKLKAKKNLEKSSSLDLTIASVVEASQHRKIRTNTYVDPKPVHWSQEVEKCGCKPSRLKPVSLDGENCKKITNSTTKKSNKFIPDVVWDCSDYCLNRLTYTECNSKTCPCGEQCKNQKIRKLEWASGLKVTNIESKGRGVIATKSIREGTLITEYVGEVISEETFQYRMINLYKEDAHHYCLHLDGEMLIDAYRSGSVARFVNHSCQPNCEMQKWMVNGAYRMCLFSVENIESNTELTYDYNFCSFNTENTQACRCGAVNCRGFIGGRPRAEQSESQRDRKKLFYAFGRTLSSREKLFVLRRGIFLVRCRTSGRCRRLGIQRPKQFNEYKSPSSTTDSKRRKAKKIQFLTQMSALNSVRYIRTRQLVNAQGNENITRTAQLAQVLRDLYTTLLEQKDPLNLERQLVAPFINCLKPKKYPEFYRVVGNDAVVSLGQIYSRLLDGKYTTMVEFDQNILQMFHNIELYAGRQSYIGKCVDRIKPIYKDLKVNSIALFEALTDEIIDEKDKINILSNSIIQISNNFLANKSNSNSPAKTKRRKQSSMSSSVGSKTRLERGAQVIKCVCGFVVEAGHLMVQCDRCYVWQHAYCMNIVRASESVDVTSLESYNCHICQNILPESLIREIPRHIDNNHQTDNTYFWTLVTKDTEMLKIDDFIYIPTDADSGHGSSKTNFTQKTIVRIYSLWKDTDGQRWMEGFIFLRPYNNYLKTLSQLTETSNKRKINPSIDLNNHKWHQNELVYTEQSVKLPLDNYVGRCNVLSSRTYRLGRPVLQNSCGNDDLYVCDWFLTKTGVWKELESSYLRINTAPYCFERFANERIDDDNCLYVTDDLLKIDQGSMDFSSRSNIKMKCGLNEDEKIIMKRERFSKLVSKLAEFAFERIRKLPLSSPSSLSSRSTASSRGTSPMCESSGSKSPIIQNCDYYPHCARKQQFPKKISPKSSESSSINLSIEIVENKSKSSTNKKHPNNVKRQFSKKKPNERSTVPVCKVIQRLQSDIYRDSDENGTSKDISSESSFNSTSGMKIISGILSDISVSSSSPSISSTVNRSLHSVAANDFTSIENISSN